MSLFFGLQQLIGFDFWWGLLLVVAVSSFWVARLCPELVHELLHDVSRKWVGKTLAGLVSALVLYGVFYAGGWFLEHLFPGSRSYIDEVYRFKDGAGMVRMVLSMILIGLGEEWVWRQGVQKALMNRWGLWIGLPLSVFFYAAIHLSTGNPVLVLAAACCGFFWAGLYAGFKSPWLVMVSHVTWDLAVFLIRPL